MSNPVAVTIAKNALDLLDSMGGINYTSNPSLAQLVSDAGAVTDKYRFSFLVESFYAIKRAAGDLGSGMSLLEGSYSDNNLLDWVSSKLSRVDFVDDWVSQNGHNPKSIIYDIAGGQKKEKQQVYAVVSNWVQKALG